MRYQNSQYVNTHIFNILYNFLQKNKHLKTIFLFKFTHSFTVQHIYDLTLAHNFTYQFDVRNQYIHTFNILYNIFTKYLF